MNTTEPTVWDMRNHAGWGNAIDWTSWESRRLYGHTQPRPKVGDELVSRMESGKLGHFRFIGVELARDPRDLWFATVEDIGYLDPEKEQSLKQRAPKPPTFLV